MSVHENTTIGQPLLLVMLWNLAETGKITEEVLHKALADVNLAETIVRHELMHWAMQHGIELS